VAPCDWDVDVSGCPGAADKPDEAAAATEIATEIIWALSGRRFGLCEVTVRPQPPAPVNPGLALTAFAHSRIGASNAPPPVLCPGAMPPRYITLDGPVNAVTEVRIDGAVVPAGDYQLSRNRLYRNGTEPWPSAQDMNAPPGDPGTWTVTYLKGLAVPKGGLVSAALLACELFKVLTGKPCQLPSRLTDITREGLSMTVMDPADFLDNGRTGITTIDLWLAAVNPNGLASPPTLWSPDTPPTHPRA
jgi:hypothetical protein